MKPPLVWPPPVKPLTLATAGSVLTMSIMSLSLEDIAWNEMLWSAWMLPMMRPTSCAGKKPLSTRTYSTPLAKMVSSSTSRVSPGWRSVASSVRA